MASMGVQMALVASALRNLSPLMSHTEAEVVKLACNCIGRIAMPEQGKGSVIKEKCVIPLCDLLSHPNIDVRAEATKALIYLVVEDEAKFRLVGVETDCASSS